MQDLDKEIEDLENEIFGTPEEPTEDTIIEEPSEPIVEAPKVSDDSNTEAKRFNNYKASTDITIRDLRSDLANSKLKYANLQKEYSNILQRLTALESSANNSKKIFSEEEIDILGEPAANALDKGVRDILDAKMKPLQEELERTRRDNAEREAREANRIIKSNYDTFISNLAKVVPKYEEINVSPGFLKYMKEPDEYSGVPREYLFKKAEESLDVGRIASFFIDYSKSIAPPKSNEEILSEAVTPTGSQGSTNTTHNNSNDSDSIIIDHKFIDKFYDDFSRGKYKSKKGREEARRIEDMIDKAVLSGRVQ